MRAETSQRGFVLVSVLLIALLYFGLIELIMADGARRSVEAQRFRARITANIFAENGAELAAKQMVHLGSSEEKLELPEGVMEGSFRRIGQEGFVIEATGTASGVVETRRSVAIRGTIRDSSVTIERTRHNR